MVVGRRGGRCVDTLGEPSIAAVMCDDGSMGGSVEVVDLAVEALRIGGRVKIG
jgi:hypothetical protein